MLDQLEPLGHIVQSCDVLDSFLFRQPVASTALATHALNASAGFRWVAAVVAALAGDGSSSSSSGGSAGGRPGSWAVDLPTADSVAHLLVAPQATALLHTVQADSSLQPQLLQVLLPGLISPITPAQQQHLRPSALHTCVDTLLQLAPSALAELMGTPAGLRSLQGAAQQLQQLQQELKQRQKEQRRQAGQPAAEEQHPQVRKVRESTQQYEAAWQPLARVRLFADLAVEALQVPDSSSERAAVVCRLVAGALPAAAAAVQHAMTAFPHMSEQDQDAWRHAGHTLWTLGLSMVMTAGRQATLTQRTFDSTTAALLAALQLRALLSGLEDGWRTWRLQLQGGHAS